MIICAAIKDTRTGAVFGGIRHGFIYSAMHDAGITPPHAKVGNDGVLDIKPCTIEKSMVCCMACTECYQNFWMKEMK